MSDPTEVQGNGPTIGVVIPAFNRQETIERALASVLGQSRRPNQVVVVDDGSTDRTADVVGQFTPQVELVEQANQGAAVARNMGVAALGTEWVAFLDSDDHWRTAHLENMEAAIRGTDAAADLYFCDSSSAELPQGTTWWDRCGFGIEGPYKLEPDATDWVMKPLHPFRLPATVMRRRRYLGVGGMWPELRGREDTHLFFELGLGGPFCAVAGVGLEVTADDDSGQRLTESEGAATSSYANYTVLLYRDLLERNPDLTSQHRRELESRLLDGYLASASVALRRRDPAGLRPLARALRLSPATTMRRLSAAVRGPKR